MAYRGEGWKKKKRQERVAGLEVVREGATIEKRKENQPRQLWKGGGAGVGGGGGVTGGR